jgi:hypothetical protein
MSSKEKPNHTEKTSSKKQVQKAAIENALDTIAQQQPQLPTLIQRAKLDPASLPSRDVLQLQRASGNRAVSELLSGTEQSAIQRQPEEEESPPVQAKPLIQTDGPIAAVVQRIPLPEGVAEATPAGKIIDSMTENSIDALKTAFHKYAADHWVYAKTASEVSGAPLLDGTQIIGACQTFAAAFVQIAIKLGYPARTRAAKAADNKRWLMVPGLTTFDGQKGDWKGRWIFDNHVWAEVDGNPYDPLFNSDTGDPTASGKVADTLVHVKGDDWRLEKGNATLVEGFEPGVPISEGTLAKLKEFGEANPGTAEGKQALALHAQGTQGVQTWKKKHCYLTTACVEARGLPDDCHELTTLRRFRDGYLRSLPGGEALISDYYAMAPGIVARVMAAPDAAVQLDQMYQRIVKVVEVIEAGRNAEALAAYIDVALDLKRQYPEPRRG